MNELWAIVTEGRAAVAKGLPTVLATVVAVRGSAYRRPGARMLVTSEGWRAGSVSGGCLEADVARRAAFLVSNGQPMVRTYDTSEDAGARLGCGGEVDLLLEPVTDTTFLDELARVAERRQTLKVVTALEGRVGEREVWCEGTCLRSTWTQPREVRRFEEVLQPAPKLVVVGAGHDALPVVRLGVELGWSVDVVDWRPGLVTAARFPHAAVQLASSASLREKIPREPGAVAVVMSHHLDYDAAALDVLLRDDTLASVGLLGPRHRASQVLALVESRHGALSASHRARLKAPVGLDLGGEGPAAVALSILAEAQAVLQGRSALPLSAPVELVRVSR